MYGQTLDQFDARLKKKSGEVSQPTMGDIRISAPEKAPTEKPAIHAEGREIMQKKFAEGRASLRSNPGLCNSYDVTLGTATSIVHWNPALYFIVVGSI